MHSHSTAADAAPSSRDDALTALYAAHALSLIRLGYVMLGDRQAAEDVVQEAFAGLHRRWRKLKDQAKALQYLRASVLNGCRTALRRSRASRVELIDPDPFPAVSAEAAALASEEQRVLMNAIRGGCRAASVRRSCSGSTWTSRRRRSPG